MLSKGVVPRIYPELVVLPFLRVKESRLNRQQSDLILSDLKCTFKAN